MRPQRAGCPVRDHRKPREPQVLLNGRRLFLLCPGIKMQSAHRYVGVRMANDILDLFQIHSKLIPAGQPQQNILALSRRVRQQPILPHGFDGDARRSCLRQPGQLLRAFVDAIHHDSVGGDPLPDTQLPLTGGTHLNAVGGRRPISRQKRIALHREADSHPLRQRTPQPADPTPKPHDIKIEAGRTVLPGGRRRGAGRMGLCQSHSLTSLSLKRPITFRPTDAALQIGHFSIHRRGL